MHAITTRRYRKSAKADTSRRRAHWGMRAPLEKAQSFKRCVPGRRSADRYIENARAQSRLHRRFPKRRWHMPVRPFDDIERSAPDWAKRVDPVVLNREAADGAWPGRIEEEIAQALQFHPSCAAGHLREIGQPAGIAIRAIIETDQAVCPSGKSLRLFRNRVNPPKQKYSASHFWKSRIISFAVSSPRRGVRDRHEALGWDAVDACGVRRLFAPDEALSAYGEVVWSWRRDAGVKLAGSFSQVTVTTSPLTGESTK